MTNPHSLFHYTDKFETLLEIIKTGFRFSYSLERFPQTAINAHKGEIKPFLSNALNHGFVGIPMICFCDIPISRASDHTKNYNKYYIGLNKDYIIGVYCENFNNLSFNPILYVSAANLFLTIQDLYTFDRLRIDLNLDKSKFNTASLCNIWGLQKQFYGYDYKLHKDRRFYDENEWRCIYLDKINSETNWIWDLPQNYEDAKQSISVYNERLHKSPYAYLQYEQDRQHCIRYLFNHIIVQSDDEIERVIDVIRKSPTLFGIELLKNSDLRQWLLTKITSFERIENDY